MPITDRSQAKEGGFAQVRDALQKFKGLVTDIQWGQWGGQLVDDQGKKKPPRDFLEVTCTDVEVLETTEELAMDISEKFTFRVNCSDFKGSFWIDMFLASADAFKILIPDGLKGKVITWEKQTLEAKDPKYNKTDWVIVGVENAPAGSTTKKVVSAPIDPLEVVFNLALGKTEGELQGAINNSPALAGTPSFPLAQNGMLTQALIKAKRLVVVDGKYQKA